MLTYVQTATPNSRYDTLQADFGYICENGYFCEVGSDAVTCPDSEKYNPQFGLTSQSGCRDCPPGKICANGLDNGLCPAGTYCYQNGLNKTCDSEYKCPEATTHQVKCQKGEFQDLFGQPTCQSCPEGSFCDGFTANSPVGPTPCPDGYQCPDRSETAFAVPCEPGTLGNTSGGCDPCPVGKYCPNYGMPNSTRDDDKFDCSAGYFCDLNSSTPFGQKSITDAKVECDAGKFCSAGTASQELCPVGTYRSETRGISQESCQPCPGGFNCE